jgi:hypothetical protein
MGVFNCLDQYLYSLHNNYNVEYSGVLVYYGMQHVRRDHIRICMQASTNFMAEYYTVVARIKVQ